MTNENAEPKTSRILVDGLPIGLHNVEPAFENVRGRFYWKGAAK